MAALSSAQQPFWSSASSKLTFPAGRVDVWQVRLDDTAPPDSGAGGSSVAPPGSTILSPDEIARANRFHFDKDRLHFTRCRSALRHLLTAYLQISPEAIVFEYKDGGKPQLRANQNPRALQFNVSHSGGLALIAIGSEHQLGIDIEKMRADVDTLALAERFFSPRERASLHTLPESLQALGFYACWTRKEAFLKATGQGLSFPLTDFSVTTHPDHRPEIEEIQGDSEARKHWFLSDLSVAEGYRAAVAFNGQSPTLATYLWT
jgi:4'-phosphopantetheinyl transferase